MPALAKGLPEVTPKLAETDVLVLLDEEVVALAAEELDEEVVVLAADELEEELVVAAALELLTLELEEFAEVLLVELVDALVFVPVDGEFVVAVALPPAPPQAASTLLHSNTAIAVLLKLDLAISSHNPHFI